MTQVPILFKDGGHDVISHRKVLPFGEWTPIIRPAHMQQRPPAAARQHF